MAAPPKKALAPPVPPKLLGLHHRGGSLLLGSGTPILTELSAPGATVQRIDSSGAAILGVATQGSEEALHDCSLGKLSCCRFLALGRTSLWWMSPAWSDTTSNKPAAAQVPFETQLLLLEHSEHQYSVLLPLIDSGRFRATLHPPPPGSPSQDRVVLRIESGSPSCTAAAWPAALYVAAGTCPFTLLESAVAAAARLSGTAQPRVAKAVPWHADRFGWCTWDAFYSRVSASGVDAGLRSLTAGGVAPRWLILDDGWQQTDVDLQYRSATGTGLHSSSTAMGLGSAVLEVEAAALELVAPSDGQSAEARRSEVRTLGRTTTIYNNQLFRRISSSLGLSTSTSRSASRSAAIAIQEEGGASQPSLRELLSSLLARGYAALLRGAARLEATALRGLKALLDASPPGSWLWRLFAAAVRGPLLRRSFLRFYAAASDHTRRLVSVRANAKFSSPDAGAEHPLNSTSQACDLKEVVEQLKQRYGGVRVFAWHSMAGFWGGISLSDPEMQKYGPKLLLPQVSPSMLSVEPSIAYVQPVLSGVALPADPVQLQSDMHQYLASCGVDGVKVDVQSTIGLVGSATVVGGPALAAAYHASLEASVQAHFGQGNRLINCMCHSTEDLYCMSQSNLARVSDDFYPSLPASWTTHIPNCAYNSLLISPLVLPDWDMATVSGGPVYVSDRPGSHDHELLRRLVLPDGSVLRALLPGRPTADCLFVDPQRDGCSALKVWSANAYTGVLGVFNVQGSAFSRSQRKFVTHDATPPAVSADVRPSDIPALAGAASTFAVWSDQTQALTVVGWHDEAVSVTLPAGGSDVVVVSAVLAAGDGSNGVRLAPIGLTDMLNGGGAVLSCRLQGADASAELIAPPPVFSNSSSTSSGREAEAAAQGPLRFELALRGAGSLLCYSSTRPAAVLLDGAAVDFSYDSEAAALRFDLRVNGASLEHTAVIMFSW